MITASDDFLGRVLIFIGQYGGRLKWHKKQDFFPTSNFKKQRRRRNGCKLRDGTKKRRRGKPENSIGVRVKQSSPAGGSYVINKIERKK